MAQNLFTDFPDRIEQLKKYCELSKLAVPLEESLCQTTETERSVTELCWLTQKRSSVLGSAPLLEWSKLIQMMSSMLMSCNSHTISQNACDMVKLASLSTPPPRERQATARMKPDQVTQWLQWTKKTM